MSDSLTGHDIPQGSSTPTTPQQQTQKEEMNGSVEIHAITKDHEAGDMGDIGNPPHKGNFTQNSEADKKEEKEKENKDKDKEGSHTPPSPTTHSPPSSSPSLSFAVDEMDARRGSSSTPPLSNHNDDGESIDSESSPAPMKRSFVLSGREHEDTDDFLLSTMLAIRTAVLAGTKDATKLAATPEDFCASRKHKISMAGDRKVEVKDYAPVVFTLIRRHFGVSIPAYLLSWSDSRLAKSKSAGKSDSMFIHSPDNKFVLKTLGRDEAKRLCKILRPYYDHLIDNKDTFMSRIYGLHRMSRRRGQSSIYFAIFNNVFDAGHPLTEIYDLKGSTVGRRASTDPPTMPRRSSTSFEFRQVKKAITEEQALTPPTKKPTVLKDLDFTRKLHVGPENRAKVLNQLSRDCKFLAQHQLMDYSLLIGIRRTDGSLTMNGPIPERSESPVPILRNHTPISSPSPDQRVVPVIDGVPLLVPASPRVQRHSISSSFPSSKEQRLPVPGLLFFLESSKPATSKSLRETKRDRRKSVSEGSGSALMRQIAEEDAAEEAAAAEQTKEADPTTTATTEPATTEPTTNSNTSTPSETPLGTPPTHNSLATTTEIHPVTTKPEELTSTPKETTPLSQTPPPMITVEAAEDDESEIAPVGVTVRPPSPVVPRNRSDSESRGNGDDDDSGNSGEVGALKAAARGISSPINGKEIDDDDTDDSSVIESPEGSPRSSLGILTVNSVPNFQYFQTHPPVLAPLTKSGSSSLRMGSPHTPTMKRNNRSASLTYVNLDPLCGNPHIPFYKNNEGGLPGATFVPLDANKSDEIYYIGLIDFLQKYNKKKKLAGFAKSLKYEKEELSTVDPVFYMERFLKMTERSIVE